MEQSDNSVRFSELPPTDTSQLNAKRPPMTSPLSSTESSVPARFKEGSFRRFESVLVRYMASYPVPLFVKPVGLTTETFTCRIRDAVKALMRNPQWSLRLADDCATHWERTTVSHDGTNVRIGPKVTKDFKGSYEVVQNAMQGTERSSNEVTLGFHPSIFEQTCRLLELLDGEAQFRFTRQKLNNDIVQLSLTNHPNVEAIQDGEDVVLM